MKPRHSWQLKQSTATRHRCEFDQPDNTTQKTTATVTKTTKPERMNQINIITLGAETDDNKKTVSELLLWNRYKRIRLTFKAGNEAVKKRAAKEQARAAKRSGNSLPGASKLTPKPSVLTLEQPLPTRKIGTKWSAHKANQTPTQTPDDEKKITPEEKMPAGNEPGKAAGEARQDHTGSQP